MRITDKEALREMRLIHDGELYDSVQDYPEDERDGRSDLQFIADEVSYIISCFNEHGHCNNEALEWAKEVLKDTKNGKVIPYENLIPLYKKGDVTRARDIINTYRRYNNSMKRLNAKGYYGQW